MNRILQFAGMALGIGLWASSASGAVIIQSGSGATEVDLFAGTTHTLSIAGGPHIITDVNVSVELGGSSGSFGFLHWGDLDMFLFHDGIEVQLLDHDNPDDCCSDDDPFDVTFDDESANTLGAAGAVGTFKPQNGSLSDFDGASAAGTWELRIFDALSFEEETDLVAWSVTIVTAENRVPEPGTLALFGTGLAGLGFAMRRRTR